MIIPDVIYLQIDGEQEGLTDPFEGATWCTDKINTTDVQYMRTDLLERVVKTIGSLLEALYASA